mmetsp:Transcript_39014/g.82036  ORF Transcript_39014/g.82036 Transcript_39014/m.82036 type:complete len:213 (-) Transcript_39014:132-770(-)
MPFPLAKRIFIHITGKEVDKEDSVVGETWYMWLRRWVFGFLLSANGLSIIATLVPVFQPITCHAIPSARAFLITFVVVGALAALLGIYKNVTILLGGGRAKFNPFEKDDKSIPARISRILGPVQMLLGLTWGSAITFPNMQYHLGVKGVDHPECDRGYFAAILAVTIIIWVIFGLIVLGSLFYFFVWLPRQRAKEEKEGENSLSASLLPEEA